MSGERTFPARNIWSRRQWGDASKTRKSSDASRERCLEAAKASAPAGPMAGLTISMAATRCRPRGWDGRGPDGHRHAPVPFACLRRWRDHILLERRDIDSHLRAGVDARLREVAGRELFAELWHDDHRPTSVEALP